MREERCEECGFDFGSISGPDAPEVVRAFGRRYRAPLTRLLPGEDESILRQRPDETTWSALEYAAHFRTVLSNYTRWTKQMLAEDRPVLEGLGADDAVREGKFNELDPATVADELAANSEALATVFESVPEDKWDRMGIRRGGDRSVRFWARHAVHEGNHHLLDIGRALRSVRGR